MIEIILTLLVITQGIVALCICFTKDNEIRGLKNQVKMRDISLAFKKSDIRGLKNQVKMRDDIIGDAVELLKIKDERIEVLITRGDVG